METRNTIKIKTHENNGALKHHKEVLKIIEKYEEKRKKLDADMYFEISKLNDFEWKNNAYEYFLKNGKK